MNKLFLWALIPLSLVLSSLNLNPLFPSTQESTEVRTIADLSPEEKAEFIEHIIKTGNCEWKGIKLYGKVKFVSSFPDIKIKYVSSFADIHVKMVSSFPDDCGEWKEVSSFPDFKVQVVSSFPDLKVKKVSSFPGMK